MCNLRSEFNPQGDRWTKEPKGLFRQGMEEQGVATVVVLPTEDQELLDQFPGSFRPRYDLSDMAMRLALSRNRRKCQLAEAEYGRETVVQLVRDTAGKGADGFPPRCLSPSDFG